MVERGLLSLILFRFSLNLESVLDVILSPIRDTISGDRMINETLDSGPLQCGQGLSQLRLEIFRNSSNSPSQVEQW